MPGKYIGDNRVDATERLLIGVPLTAIASVVLVVVMVAAIIVAMIDIFLSFLLNRDPYGKIETFHAYWEWVEHNGHRLLYGEHNHWQWLP